VYFRWHCQHVKARIPSTLSSVILWSVISAAFIGPGTVTTAVAAGSQFQLQLLWAVVFSTFACLALQEVAARLTIATQLTLGEAIRQKFGAGRGMAINYAVGGAVVLGCAAYQAGNLLGAIAGLQLLFPASHELLAIMVALAAALVLFTGKRQTISVVLTGLVGAMGLAFLLLASYSHFSAGELLAHSVVPHFPAGATLLTLGLVGTTIVPYNIFLGTGVSRGQTIPLMRVGLAISVAFGGAITIFILLAGTLVASFSSYEELALVFVAEMGWTGRWALGIGLFAAGFSSAITAPYAASLVSATVFDWSATRSKWVWISVLAVGLVFGITNTKPIPVILLVQTLNGFILPLLGGYLLLVINDRDLVPAAHRPSEWYNVVLLLIFATLLVLGLHSLDKTYSQVWGKESTHWPVVWALVIAITGILGYHVFRKR
jgi:Mn2+/Fe2+ NRAMP family transporter